MTDTTINDITTYNERMRKALIDKVFFVDKVDANVFVDFGCADGTVLGFLQRMFPENRYIGYDISDEMVDIARKVHSDIEFTSDLNMVIAKLVQIKKENPNTKTCLILNSVIHEVYSYSSFDEIERFYNTVFSSVYDYVVIRDMMPNSAIDRPADITDVARVRAFADHGQLDSFEDVFGRIDNNKNLIHFLLKYKYKENWNREVRENYMPITTQQFISRIPKNYSIDYYHEFLLPHIKRTVSEDFGIFIKDTTHVKIILRKEDV